MPRRIDMPGAEERVPAAATDDDAVTDEGVTDRGSGPDADRSGSARAGNTGSVSHGGVSREDLTDAASAAPPGEGAPSQRTDRAARLRIDRAQPTGRVRHDGKITVYLSSAELMLLEQVRLQLRGDYGISVDRGRVVRTAISIVVQDLLDHDAESQLVRRLSEQ